MDRTKYRNTLNLLSIFMFLIFVPNLSLAQYGHEWIDYNQQYFKIPSAQTGIYRVSKTELENAGVPVSSINPQHIQVFHRGKEQAIFINGENDGTWDNGDYVEFYGIRNDGSRDFRLYKSPSQWLNPNYNLYTDTTAYFLTWTLDGTLGKRMTQVNLTSANPPNTYHWQEYLQNFSDTYSRGQNYPKFPNNNAEIYLSDFDTGEGWVSNRINAGAPNEGFQKDIEIPVQNLFSGSGVVPTLEVVVAGQSSSSVQETQVLVGASTSSLRDASTLTYSYANKRKFNINLLTSDFASDKIVVRVKQNVGSMAVAYVKLRYPQTYNMNLATSQDFIIPRNLLNTDNSLFNITNIPSSNIIVYDITDRNNIQTIQGTLTGTTFTASLNTVSEEKKLLVNERNNVLNVPSIEAVNFTQPDLNSDYLIITHPSLRQAFGGYSDIVQAYADYRESLTGGSYNVYIANIDRLYNQFNYGERSPLAIRYFADYLYDNGNPEYLLLIGQAMSLPDPYHNHNIRHNPAHQALDLVPTGGYPPSDIFLTAQINPVRAFAPALATGRLSVTKAEEVYYYLEKVKEHEARAPNVWHKNVVHLSGGRTTTEQTLFSGYLDFYEDLAIDKYLGASVSNFSKTTTASVELINISEQVNDGVGLITFFGHSAPDVTDVEIGFVSDDIQGYHNQGKYPLILSNGCFLSAIFYNNPNMLSLDWMFTPNRGSIGFLGHSSIGYSLPLFQYSTNSYSNYFTDSTRIGKPIGWLNRDMIQRYGTPTNEVALAHSQQVVLQGDPAVSVSERKPDYYIDETKISLESFAGNNSVSAVDDSLKVNIIVSNYGRTDPFQEYGILVKRTYNDGTSFTYEFPNFSPVDYIDTVWVSIPNVAGVSAYGLNTFEVSLDYQDNIDEVRENNNSTIFQYFIPTIGVLPLLPYEYAITNTQPVSLVALASSLIDEGREFIFQLDTIPSFDSPALQTQNVASGLTAIWDVNLLANDASHDSTVYYWRVNYVDALNDPSTLWGESSFVYIQSSPEGWNQSHFGQFSKAKLENIEKNTDENTWEFQSIFRDVEVGTYGINYSAGNPNTDVYALYEGLAIIFNNGCGQDRVNVMTFRRSTGSPYSVSNQNTCGREGVANSFTNIEIANGALQNYLTLVPEGDYVLIFSAGQVDFSTWTSSLKSQVLLEIGGNPATYNTLATGHPYIILGQKGASPGSAYEVIGSSDASTRKITMNQPFEIKYANGTITSTRIGPAKNWQTAFHEVLAEGNDTYEVNLIGESLSGASTVLETNMSDNFDLNSIDATLYPYLRLEMKTSDTEDYTPAQLKKWLVVYDGVPEGFINVDAIGKEKYEITEKLEGETFKLDFVFQNISKLDFEDSLVVEYTFTNPSAPTVILRDTIAPLPASESIQFSLDVETLGRAGDNQLRVYVNPIVQAERYYENNIYTVNYRVKADDANPILEVAFDGVQIMDGDIVSPSPLISIMLRDENAFIQRENINGINMALKAPCETCTFEEIAITDPRVQWNQTEALTQVDLQLDNLEDGIYTLRVQGEDASGNKSGVNPYIINFEVINRSTVTNVLPYPNPFSTSTQFVFTLTGRVVPDEMKIQIMTVSGKVVREITQDEIGPIHIGNNRTEFHWDGTDEFGDKLANGPYLYRVIMRGNGEKFEQRQTAADKAFKKGFGKLYIMR